MKILQITPHLGGGLGRVLINWVRADNKIGNNIHTIACLEKTYNATESFEDLKDNFIDNLYEDQTKLTNLIEDSDIVIINWYNHPLLFDIMINYKFPACNLICYNHVSSLNPPYNMSKELIRFFDKIVFTTEASFDAKEVKDPYSNDYNSHKFVTIESAFGTEQYLKDNPRDIIKKTATSNFNIGYVGTASYSKLDKNFVKLCDDVKIKNARFVVCSGDSQEHIRKDIEKICPEYSYKFFLEGRVPNITPYLKKFHVFGYPLQPKHLGSAEQVFGETMLFGAVPVAMNNPAERYIIENNKTGILANTYEEYSQAIEYLYYNPDIRKHMAVNAHLFAKDRYSMNRKINSWNEVFKSFEDKLLRGNREWNNINYQSNEIEGYKLFIHSIGDYGKVFEAYTIKANNKDEIIKIKELFNSNEQWFSDNKGGVRQYLKYFPDDMYLQEWSELLSECE